MPRHHVESHVIEGNRRTVVAPGFTEEFYPKTYWPGEEDFDHLEFALRREGFHLALLRRLLPRLGDERMTAYVRSKPTGAYARRLWFLYEAFTGHHLEIDDLSQGNYISLLDEEEYCVGFPERSKRHRINVNLLGRIDFTPMVRRTEKLRAGEEKRLDERCRQVLSEIPPELYQRAIHYLYAKETKSSYDIEREKPDQIRANRFAELLKEAAKTDYLEQDALVTLQNSIVDPRYANKGWRDTIREQNYVGRSLGGGGEEIHFIPPRPSEIAPLMADFLNASKHLLASTANPVAVAAAIAYPFVFLHPFTDGNGRIHRFLIHYVLPRLGFAPEGIVFPVSAIMLHDPKAYDASLEAFSRRLVPRIDYELDAWGKMTVREDTADFYRYIDCTAMAEALFDFVERTIEEELPTEITYLRRYDEARRKMREIVDMPNTDADLFIRFCRQNNGRLGNAKQHRYEKLTTEEISRLETVIREIFENGG